MITSHHVLPLGESVGESASRVRLMEEGLPRPELQHEIFGPDGRVIARVDFCWEEHKTVGEFDGKIKYGRLLKPGEWIEDVIFDERIREDASPHCSRIALGIRRRRRSRRKVRLRSLLLRASARDSRRSPWWRDLGLQVVRWIWRDLYRAGVLRERVLRAFGRAS